MNKIYVEPNGKATGPETAYAELNKLLKDDLHLSVSNFCYRDRDRHLTNLFIRWQPLVVNKLGGHSSRNAEQYLIQIPNVLRPGINDKRGGARSALERGKQTAHPCIK